MTRLRSCLSLASLIVAVCFTTAHAEPSKLPAQRFESLKGETVSLASQTDKVLVVNFWATWCPPCVKEMPAFNRLQQQVDAHSIQVIAINLGDTKDQIDQFIAQLNSPLAFAIWQDAKAESYQTFKLLGLPTTLIYDTHGQLIKTVTGPQEWDSPEVIEQLIRLTADNKKAP